MLSKHRANILFLSFFSLLFIGLSQQAFGQEKDVKAVVPNKELNSSLGMKFVYISPGTFMMGSPENEEGRDKDEEAQHRVTLTKGFYIQTTAVTVGQWRAFVRDTGYKSDAENKGSAYIWFDGAQQEKKGYFWDKPGFQQSDDHPVTCVTWKDISAFIGWLDAKEGKTYRLPTEAEWEYACRAGTATPYSWGDKADCSKANYGNGWSDECKGKNPEGTVKVGSFPPNPWGLYDMSGNIWESCRDWYGDYPKGHVTDPKGPSTGKKKVVRGGSWLIHSRYCRSAARAWNGPNNPYANLGFRLVLVP
ncbi:MAG: formylglycine-generating enzyme family protein [Deltaproteobacteria bacterium]|nr:formylglycine-generating enzyme family protein [Deltaproteobacteria bacterium]